MATIKRHGTDVSTLYTPQEYSGISLDERANDGETGQGSFPIPDPSGTTAVYAGQSLQLKVGSTVVFDAFLGGRTRDRGEAASGTRLVNIHPAVDQNAYLTGFRSGKVSRPSETDYARMTWFFTTYLPGLDRTWILNTHTATVAAKAYDTMSLWQELLSDLQAVTGKTGFVEGGRAHWHLPTEGIATGKSISDVDSDWGSDCYRIYNPKFQSDPLQLATDVLVEDSAGNSATATDSTSITEHDADGIKHQVLIQTSDTTTSLAAQAATYLAANKDERLTYECDLGPLTADDVVALPVGSLITVTSFVMGLSAVTQRIAERVLTIKHPDTFYLHLFLSWPVRRNLSGPKTIAPVGLGFGSSGIPQAFDIVTIPHFSEYGVGDPTKAATIYATAGGPLDAQVGNSYGISISGDSTAGDGTGITGTGTRTISVPAGFHFTAGVPIVFYLYAIPVGRATSTAYSDGKSIATVIDHTAAIPIPGVVITQIPASGSSEACAPAGGTAMPLGGIEVTFYPGAFVDPATTKGDLLGHAAGGVPTRIPATGNAGNVLTEDPTQATGWKSAPPKSSRTFPFFGG